MSAEDDLLALKNSFLRKMVYGEGAEAVKWWIEPEKKKRKPKNWSFDKLMEEMGNDSD